MKRITLCADDYGLHPEVSKAITLLAEDGCIQATSALVTSPYCKPDAGRLKSLRNTIDVGLHLNFTEGSGLTEPFKQGLPGLFTMLWRSHCRLFSQTQLLNEIRAQLNEFEALFGTAPDFIDGHQHVHHLPQVRDALCTALKERSYPKLWVRSVSPMISHVSPIKSKIIKHSGANQLKRMISHSFYKTNSAFAGIYSLRDDAAFDKLIEYWLSHLPDGSLIMCHPGLTHSGEEGIDHESARYQEFLHLQSQDFQTSLRKADVQLVRLS